MSPPEDAASDGLWEVRQEFKVRSYDSMIEKSRVLSAHISF
jgi:hypothetical protein